MKTESAGNLNEFMNNALKCYTNYCFKSKHDVLLTDLEKQRFHKNVFISLFNHFISELQENIRTYKDINLIRDYVLAIFPQLVDIEPFHEDENKWTIERGYEVHFLLCLKKEIEYYIDEIQACSQITENHLIFATSLRYYFDKEMENQFKPESPETAVSTITEYKYKREDRFDFYCLKDECSKLQHNIEKIKHINERLFDFEQWQIQFDTLIYNNDIGHYYENTCKFYLDFEQLCTIELNRLEKLIEIEKRMPVSSYAQPKTEIKTEETVKLQWTASDTDLIELLTALYHSGCIERKDGKPLTRKYLLEYFQQLFNVEIKDVEGKLARATNRNTNTPFLDNLAQEFRNYASEKMEKQRKRK